MPVISCLLLMTDHHFAPMTFVFPHPGREQAELTGKRLAALGLKYDVLIHSSMARATETAHIISRHLPGIGEAPHQSL